MIIISCCGVHRNTPTWPLLDTLSENKQENIMVPTLHIGVYYYEKEGDLTFGIKSKGTSYLTVPSVLFLTIPLVLCLLCTLYYIISDCASCIMSAVHSVLCLLCTLYYVCCTLCITSAVHSVLCLLYTLYYVCCALCIMSDCALCILYDCAMYCNHCI